MKDKVEKDDMGKLVFKFIFGVEDELTYELNLQPVELYGRSVLRKRRWTEENTASKF